MDRRAIVAGTGMTPPRRLTGSEALHADGTDLKAFLIHFWQWADSDLRSNVTRGRFAEYLVARDLGVAHGVRSDWLSHDITAADKTRIEVKSAAYVQSWFQKRPSPISFDIRPTLSWDPDTGEYGDARRRQSDVYVFCLLHEQDETKLDPLNVAHWRFFILPTRVLDQNCPDQKTLSLRKLQSLHPEEVSFGNIAAAVQRATLRSLQASGDEGSGAR